MDVHWLAHYNFKLSLSTSINKMATYVAGFINDLSAVKDNIKLRVRIVRSWMQDVYGKQGLKNLELVIMDEQVSKYIINQYIAIYHMISFLIFWFGIFDWNRALRCKRLCVWHWSMALSTRLKKEVLLHCLDIVLGRSSPSIAWSTNHFVWVFCPTQ